MNRAFYTLVIALTLLVLPIVYLIAEGMLHFHTKADDEIGMFALLFSGPLLVAYSFFCFFLDVPTKGKKVLTIIGFASGILWMSYLLKACADGEFE
ncbi:hypothetical protein IC229_21910 [Spirosoma sp. BT702]|uniref:Uncharacterized protein n=1 Tax=Spirosoma profusum TaxID=2771354 RepID=A0A927AS53_9BACT|nr:hypothetical protein [Spirosoma profusum]MBD2703316.1 hypothetical protein [Spirosoma profusum]